MNKLAEYLDFTGIKHAVFAKKIGTTTTTLHNILRKGLTPSLKLAIAIEKETKGKIRVYDWLEPVKDKKHGINKNDD